jgi:hypothetical protein
MTKDVAIKVGKDMIYLASCALHGRIPERDELCEMDLNNVYKMAKFHSMQSIVYICLAKAVKEYGKEIVSDEVFHRFATDYQLTMKRLVMFDMEREAFCEFLGQRSWYLCLKGVVLQRYYPTLAMRQMADNDILVDINLCPEIREYFLSRGYESESFGVGCHDSYYRGVLNFEIHHRLFSGAVRTRRGSDYYSDVKSMLIPGEKPGEMLFTDNDFYVYFLYHAYKHYAEGGCGVRTLMDIFVYRSKNGNIDEKYIKKQLDSLGIQDYADGSYRLAMKIFSPEARPCDVLDSEMEEMLEYYISSGTFGTQAHMVENNAKDLSGDKGVTFITKIKYIWKRLFPDMSYYNLNYPRASKLIFTIPMLWFARFFRGIKNRKTHKGEIEHLNKL